MQHVELSIAVNRALLCTAYIYQATALVVLSLPPKSQALNSDDAKYSSEDDGQVSDTSVNDVDLELEDRIEIGYVSMERYQETGHLNDLNTAVQKFQEVVDLTPQTHPDRADRLQNLAVSFTYRYHRLGELKAVDHPDRASQLQGLAGSLTDRYRRLGDLNDLEAALQNKQQAVQLTPADHPDRASQLQGLAVSWTDRYRRLGELTDLETALQGVQEAVDLTPVHHPDRATRLQNLAMAFTDRYRRLGELKDVEAALERGQESVNLTSEDHPDRASRLQGVAMSFIDRYQRLGDLDDLEAALQNQQQSVNLTPPDHPNRAGQLQNLAACFTNRYRRFGELKDLEAALQTIQESVDLTPTDHLDRASRLQDLAASFTDRYQRLGELKDLETSLHNKQQAVDLTAEDHPDRVDRVQSLAESFTYRYRRLGDLNDLEVAMQKFHYVVNLTPADHPHKASRLESLAVTFADQYQRLGALEDLEAAMQKNQESVDLTPADHPHRAIRLQNLAMSFSDRYQRFRELKDLEAALQINQHVVDLTPADQADRATRLHILAMSFTDRYWRLGELKDLAATLQSHQESVDLTPADHPNRASHLQGLAASLGNRYQRLRDIKDLEPAVAKYQEAVDLTPGNHPDRALRLQGLSVSLTDRYHRLGELKDLAAALQRDKESVELTPEDHPGRAGRLQSLASSFMDQFKVFKKPENLKDVHQHYIESFKTQAPSDPEPSWRAALRWASFSEEFQPEYCSTAYSAAFNLLPELLWIGHTIPVRQDAIRRLDIGKTASDATRISLALSDPISAVQFFEQGLATTFQQMLQLRPDLDILPAVYAEKLKQLSYELYSGTSDNPSQVARERQELLQVIRKQPNLEHFLLPQPYKVLCHASQGGPVVILNSHEDGCDGIIILNSVSDPVHVTLPNTTADILQSQQTALKELLVHCGVRTRGDSASTRIFVYREGFNFRSRTIEEHFTDLLTQLWNNVVGPIYQALASHGVHNGRLWWLPSGSFIGLPLHACSPTDQYIHSYTATLGSLLEVWTQKPSTGQYKVGVVGVTHTGLQGENYLKAVEQEVQKICSVIRGPNLECLEGEQATPAAVQNKLQNCSWIHLACHGTQDLIEPTKSRLLLYNGALELEMILKMPLPHAEFVFLAACQTAMGDATLVNESFHLGGGFIAAGFRGAIGTLWSMNDQDGPVVAETVYSHIFRDGRRPQASDAAKALQLAVNKLKAQKIPYQRWIPFIHMGV
ncbi:CHAT domain-containing protein [Mycena maculata]|uniref:CHAT domain-containing protein n=1 Tax=Mycena maculata TaxID=230809 RepID=A0AAD7H7B0_9AGAR|nr:CHAT domain-containing protein [Mycena maculata]